jgi:CRISPR-associated endonuclease/helicase Cas3
MPSISVTRHALLKRQFPASVRQDASHFIQEVARILVPEGLPFSTRDYDNLRPLFIRASWLVAGLAVAADWLGSNQQWFPYWDGAPLSCENYWNDFALDRANTALRESGLAPVTPAPFHRMTELFDSVFEPTPLQQLVESMRLAQGPQLVVIEEVTGGGKTEAALTLAARLLAAGAADGIYLALPTMATADAMHSRVERVYRRFFAKGANASLVLAHSMAAFSLDLERANKADAGYGSKEHDSASGHCTAWLADSRKKALLAHVGVGTIDQALLGILAAKHQSLRLWGLLGKVLIADEVHACDAYVTGLLKTLLKFHPLSVVPLFSCRQHYPNLNALVLSLLSWKAQDMPPLRSQKWRTHSSRTFLPRKRARYLWQRALHLDAWSGWILCLIYILPWSGCAQRCRRDTALAGCGIL